MAVKMKLAPVFYTLAQIKFNYIAKMVDYIPIIQDILRHKGFPDYQEDEQNSIIIQQLSNTDPSIRQQKLPRWEFNNIAQNEGFLFFQDSIVFHTTDYGTYKQFLEKLFMGINVLQNVVRLSYIDRLGLRYLNLINPKNNQEIDGYLKKEFLGLTKIMPGIFKHSFSETSIGINEGTLVVKSFITHDSIVLPPDLSALKLKLNPRFIHHGDKIKSILDIDYFLEDRFEFDLDRIKETFIMSHNIISQAFHSSITEFAMHSWS